MQISQSSIINNSSNNEEFSNKMENDNIENKSSKNNQSNKQKSGKFPLAKRFPFEILQMEKEFKNSIQPEILTELKRLHFVSIKIWEEKRVKKLSYHKSICENLLKKLFQTANESIENHLNLCKFFNDRIKQDFQFSNYENSHALSQQTKCVLKNPVELDYIYLDIENFQLVQKQKFLEFSNFMKNEILKNKIEKFLNNFRVEIKNNSNLFEKNKKNLIKFHQKLSKKYEEFSKVLNEKLRVNSQNPNKDLYLFERKYFNKVYEHFMLQKEFGQNVINFFFKIKKFEGKRVKNLIKIFQKYFNNYRKIFLMNVENINLKIDQNVFEEKVKLI